MATAAHMKASRPPQAKAPRYEPILDLSPLPPEQYAALRDHIARSARGSGMGLTRSAGW
jgi:hypothetical protein